MSILSYTYSPDDRLAPALRRAMLFAFTVLAVAFSAPASHGQELTADSQDAEVLTRGPIHDAFAMPVGLDPVAGVVVPREPPADIEELPPEVAVEDPSAVWIAGYWNWDEERKDFIWISGVWRVAPPNHRWVAGYWTEVAGGFQRVSGFWAPTEVRQVVYYPQPPESLEAGPNSPQPSPNHFWVPGNWVNTDGRYVWRGGYWAASQESWVWIPASYVRTPGGYIYNAGYWDHPFDDRGMMFAPVYFRQNVYTRPNFYYSPSVVMRTASLLVHLFARPSYGSYYFGDYYGPSYATAGYYPWFAAGGAPRGNVRWYDPIYTYQRSHHHGDPNWSRDLHRQHDFYAANQDARPRHTYDEQRRYAAAQGPNRDRKEINNINFATSVKEFINNNSLNGVAIKNVTNVQVRRVENDERKAIQKESFDVKQFAKQRSQVEKQSRVAVGEPDPRGRGPRPGNEGRPGIGVAGGAAGATLTLPELTKQERNNDRTVGRGPVGDRNVAGEPNNAGEPNRRGPGPRPGVNATDPNATVPNVAAPNVAGPNGRPNREGPPNRFGLGLPQRPDTVAGPNAERPNGKLPNGVNPNADQPRTGLPSDMPQGRRTGSAVPGVVPGTENPKPEPRAEQPRTEQPRTFQPGNPPKFNGGKNPNVGNNGPNNRPGRGPRPEAGGAPGTTPGSEPAVKREMPSIPTLRERPQQTERPQGERKPQPDRSVVPQEKPQQREQPRGERPQQRPQPKAEPKPQEVPKVALPVAPQTPPDAKPENVGKPDKKKKKD